MMRTEDEEHDALTGLEHVDVSDLLTGEFRAAVCETLPLADPSQRDNAFNKVILEVRCYRGLRQSKHSNLSSMEVRQHLRRGLDLARDLEKWIANTPPIVRDYVLSAMGREAKRRGSTFTEQTWPDLRERFCALQERIREALKFVKSDRGRPENAELNDLVRSLALIWEEYTNHKFSLTKKGDHTPYAFVRMVCRVADSRIVASDFDRQLGTALRLATRRFRRARQECSKK